MSYAMSLFFFLLMIIDILVFLCSAAPRISFPQLGAAFSLRHRPKSPEQRGRGRMRVGRISYGGMVRSGAWSAGTQGRAQHGFHQADCTACPARRRRAKVVSSPNDQGQRIIFFELDLRVESVKLQLQPNRLVVVHVAKIIERRKKKEKRVRYEA